MRKLPNFFFKIKWLDDFFLYLEKKKLLIFKVKIFSWCLQWIKNISKDISDSILFP